MSDKLRSPLAHRSRIETADGAVSLSEWRHQTKFVLRGGPEEVGPLLSPVLGVGLPGPTSTARTDTVTCLWLGPDEWMLVAAQGVADELASNVSVALGGVHHQFVEVTDQLTAISLTGSKAREMLMKLTTLDLHASRFKPGDTAGSHFGGATATLCMTADAPPNFELFVRRSYADYLWCVLAEAGREFGLPEQVPQSGEAMRG